MRASSALSVALHTGILVSGIVKPPPPPPDELETEVIPITVVSLDSITPVVKPEVAPRLKPMPPGEQELAEEILPEDDPEARQGAANEEADARWRRRLENILRSVRPPDPPSAPSPGRASATGEPEENEPNRLRVASLQALAKARIERDCWRDPSDMRDAENLQATIVVHLSPDGSLAEPPRLVRPRGMPTDPATRIFVERAFRAVQKCAPYDYLPRASYAVWKTLELNFSGAPS